ncbi:hypothetical protein MPSYJ_09050 [Mycolicibacterium psychrotolerans]|uniref:Uncharacterized protein n=1 Tax=Mycolicibacterium psychrotolerans TaxID=216929 RepID=A0A7I7M5I8_9MYCO|nr:hypothetical protein MPSYJ_09050 [Mycolicibacterium psychrotolerans]
MSEQNQFGIDHALCRNGFGHSPRYRNAAIHGKFVKTLPPSQRQERHTSQCVNGSARRQAYRERFLRFHGANCGNSCGSQSAPTVQRPYLRMSANEG